MGTGTYRMAEKELRMFVEFEKRDLPRAGGDMLTRHFFRSRRGGYGEPRPYHRECSFGLLEGKCVKPPKTDE